MKINLTIAGKQHDLGQLTLGDMMTLRKHFGITHLTQVEEMKDDPMLISGLVYLALQREYPAWEHERLMNTVAEMPLEALEDQADVESSSPLREGDEDPKADAPSVGA